MADWYPEAEPEQAKTNANESPKRAEAKEKFAYSKNIVQSCHRNPSSWDKILLLI